MIILPDGRPNAIGLNHPGMEPPIPYVGELAVLDTALEVRKTRNLGIFVLGIFVGDEDDSVSKKSFRHAVRILKLSKKVSKSCLIERAVGFLPPPHTPPAALSHQSSAGFFNSLHLRRRRR